MTLTAKQSQLADAIEAAAEERANRDEPDCEIGDLQDCLRIIIGQLSNEQLRGIRLEIKNQFKQYGIKCEV